MRRTAIALVVAGLASVLAGCAGSTSSPAAGSAVPASPVPATLSPASAAPTIALPSIALPSIALPSLAVPSGLLPSIALPSLPSEDKDLEGRLPNSINGVTLTKLSFKGVDFLTGDSDAAKDLNGVLTGLGKTPADLSIAVATDPTDQLDVSVGAFRIAGADAAAVMNIFKTSIAKETPNAKVSDVSIGGKNVVELDNPDTSSGPTYFYPTGDTVFFAQTTDPALAAAAVATFP